MTMAEWLRYPKSCAGSRFHVRLESARETRRGLDVVFASRVRIYQALGLLHYAQRIYEACD